MTMSPDLLPTRTAKPIIFCALDILHALLGRRIRRGCSGLGWLRGLCCSALFPLHAGFFEHLAAFATGADFSEAFAVVLTDEVDWVFAVDESVRTKWADVNFIL